MTNLLETHTPSQSEATEETNAVLPERGIVALLLDQQGMVTNCNDAALRLLDCMSSQLLNQPVSNLLPQLTGTALMQGGKINPRLRFLSRFGYLFDVMPPGGTGFSSRLYFNEVDMPEQQTLCLVFSPESRASRTQVISSTILS